MKQNANEKRLYLVGAVILGMLLAVCAAGLLLLNVFGTQKKIMPVKKATELKVEASQDQYAEVEQSFSGFSIGKKASQESEEESESEEDKADADQEDKKDKDKKEKKEDNDYICAASSKRKLKKSDLKIKKKVKAGFPENKSVAQMIINEIYAKHGYQFTSEELQDYFMQKEWYSSMDSYCSDMDEITKKLSAIEKKNIRFLDKYR